ncbi:DUF3024 domain-containing protein [Pseudonocardia sp. TRM90224]|uniref:DUF3024 domain-containing protein n=1 Tax=Pseudonocardia sp. TRM90224 TaxID=2812678 RepID=UPI001E3608D5|nr:hypothetical protein [Pseudonocardia sp. TRM90224]
MAVPEETRHQLSRWCADRVPEGERDEHQVGYTIQGDEITIFDRRRPLYPELGTAWSATPIAQLRPEDDRWALYRRADGRWVREGTSAAQPLDLLDAITR